MSISINQWILGRWLQGCRNQSRGIGIPW